MLAHAVSYAALSASTVLFERRIDVDDSDPPNPRASLRVFFPCEWPLPHHSVEPPISSSACTVKYDAVRVPDWRPIPVIALALVFCTLLCGLWLRLVFLQAQPQTAPNQHGYKIDGQISPDCARQARMVGIKPVHHGSRSPPAAARELLADVEHPVSCRTDEPWPPVERALARKVRAILSELDCVDELLDHICSTGTPSHGAEGDQGLRDSSTESGESADSEESQYGDQDGQAMGICIRSAGALVLACELSGSLVSLRRPRIQQPADQACSGMAWRIVRRMNRTASKTGLPE